MFRWKSRSNSMAKGDRLRSQCEARLKAAQARIDQIQLGGDGAPAAVRSFDAE